MTQLKYSSHIGISTLCIPSCTIYKNNYKQIQYIFHEKNLQILVKMQESSSGLGLENDLLEQTDSYQNEPRLKI